MRVDVHTHIFTLRAILNREAVRAITQRLRENPLPYLGVTVPDYIVQAIEEYLDGLLDRPEYFDERRMLKRLLEKLVRMDSFNDWASSALSGDVLATRVRGNLDVPVDRLRDLISALADRHPPGVAGAVVNVFETLRIASQPSITHVADTILKGWGPGDPGMDPDDVIVALMMDIYAHPESARDRRTYRHHIRETAEAALQRPGRILPFFGVHPDRPSHYEQLVHAVEHRGFVGVKLYPSLGYSVHSDTMKKVYRYCVKMDLPVLLHCGHGGFYRSKEKIQLCDPAQWSPVLEDPEFRGKLKVCFAHFGGWEALGERHALGENWPPADDPDRDDDLNWGRKIHAFMKAHPDTVYTDLAKHVGMFEEANTSSTYFDTLLEMIDDPEIRERILYGTDAWLLRLDMTFAEYRRKWREGAAATDGALFDRISTEGSKAFVGLPTAANPVPAPNIQRFVDHMKAHRHDFGEEPAPWLKAAMGVDDIEVDRDPPLWNRNRLAVIWTYQFFYDQMPRAIADGDFRALATRPMKKMNYFDRSDPAFNGKCRDLAGTFVSFLEMGAPIEEGNSYRTLVPKFVELFQDGDVTLQEMALAVDMLFRIPENGP